MSVTAAARIVMDVLVYRLRRLEMANMVAAVAIMLALHLPPREILSRGVFALVLNVLAYLINDHYDVDRDLAGGRAPAKTVFLAAHLGAARGAEIALGTGLVAMALALDVELLVAGALGVGICWVYSARLKMVPYADIAAMTAWGLAMPLVAVPFDNRMGWALVGQLALFSACFETIQVMRDRAEDLAAGIATTATALGARTLTLARGLLFVSAAYGVLVLDAAVAAALFIAPFVPFSPGAEERYWTRIRFVLGVVWLGVLARLFVTGKPAGLVATAVFGM